MARPSRRDGASELLAALAIVATAVQRRRRTPAPAGDASPGAVAPDPDAGTSAAAPPAKRLARRLDRLQRRHPRVAFPVAVVKKFSDDRAGDLAALVAYYAFFSIFPLLLAVVTVLGFVLENRPKLRQDLVDSALGQIPVIGEQISGDVGRLQGSGIGLAIGLVGAILAGLGAMSAAQTAMNRIWYVPRAELPKGLEKRGRDVLALGVIGLGTIGTTLVANVGSILPDLGVLSRVAILAGAFVVNVAVFTLAFKVLISRRLGWHDLVPGAALASLAWFVLQLFGNWYFQSRVKGADATYGTFALVIGLLTWFHLLAQITILSAEVDAVRKWKLWPRSLVPGEFGEADRKLVELQVAAQMPANWTAGGGAVTSRSPSVSVGATSST